MVTHVTVVIYSKSCKDVKLQNRLQSDWSVGGYFVFMVNEKKETLKSVKANYKGQ